MSMNFMGVYKSRPGLNILPRDLEDELTVNMSNSNAYHVADFVGIEVEKNYTITEIQNKLKDAIKRSVDNDDHYLFNKIVAMITYVNSIRHHADIDDASDIIFYIA